jgi:hypothetical protein
LASLLGSPDILASRLRRLLHRGLLIVAPLCREVLYIAVLEDSKVSNVVGLTNATG